MKLNIRFLLTPFLILIEFKATVGEEDEIL